MTNPHHFRLSSYYFFYFIAVGVVAPYLGAYLHYLGHGAKAIGEITAVLVGTKLVAPLVWGWLADHTGQRVRIIQFATVAALLCFMLLLVVDSYWGLIIVLFSGSFFWNAVLPQYEVLTLNRLGDDTERYANIRLWGSVSFILTTIVVGMLLDHTDEASIIPVLLFAMAGITVCAMLEPRMVVAENMPAMLPISPLLRRKEVIGLFLICFLMQMSHGPYYTFFTIYMNEAGYSYTDTGWFWALGVIPEVGVFLLLPWLLRRFSALKLLVVSLLVTAIRWFIVANYVDNTAILGASQLLHMASYGLYHGAAISLVHKYFRGNHQGRGQALYNAVSFGAGGALGAWMSGLLWQEHGAKTFLIASGLALLALIPAWWVRER